VVWSDGEGKVKTPVFIRMIYYGLIDLTKLSLTIAVVLGVTFGFLWAMANLEVVEMVMSYVAGTVLLVFVVGFTITYLFGLHERAVRANNKAKGP
jgi:hypothetical protein